MTRPDYCPVAQEPCQAMCSMSDVRCKIRDSHPQPKQEPVGWIEKNGDLIWNNKEAAIGRNLYTHPQPKREPPTPLEVKDVLRATGLLTNSQAWDVAEEVMKLLAAHGIKENT